MRRVERCVRQGLVLGLVGLWGCSHSASTPGEWCGEPRTPVPPAAPLSTFSYDTAAAFAEVLGAPQSAGDVEVRRISYDGWRGERATGLLLLPDRTGPHAAVLMLHGMPGSAAVMQAEAVAFARRGAVVLALDAPFARRTGPSLHFTAQDSLEQLQLIVDLRRGLDLLRRRPDVDPLRTAYIGRSYGAAMGLLFAGVEPRLTAAILAVGDGGLIAHFTGPDDPPCGLPGIPRDQWHRWLAAMYPLEPIRFAARAAPTALLFQGAEHDELVPPEDHRAAWLAASQPKQIMWYATGHGLDQRAFLDRISWLAQQVGTDAGP